MNKPFNLETIEFDHPFKEYCRQSIKANFGQSSQREIARKLSIGKTTVNRWAKNLGLFFRKHTANEKYFNSWSFEMAYMLGYIFADGNVAWNTTKGYYSLTVTASQKDKDHLERTRLMMASTKPLLYGKSTQSYRLIVNSKKICKRLIGLGVTPKKSLTLKFPKMSQRYLKDFIRGYVDGDGSLRYFARERSPYFELMISSGSEDFLKVLEKKIFKELQIRSRLFKTGKNCYVLRYFCAKGLKLATWLYQDAKIYLERKYNKYQEALGSRKE